MLSSPTLCLSGVMMRRGATNVELHLVTTVDLECPASSWRDNNAKMVDHHCSRSFRALAHIEAGHGELISRNGNTFWGFADLATWIATHLRVESAVLDGDIACVDDAGRPVFRDLLFRRRQWVFIAFDLLYLNGKDLRIPPLIERKTMLKKLLRRKRSRILYLDHVEGDGRLLFDQIVKNGSGRYGLQAEGFTIQGHGEAVAILDQGQKFALQPVGRP